MPAPNLKSTLNRFYNFLSYIKNNPEQKSCEQTIISVNNNNYFEAASIIKDEIIDFWLKKITSNSFSFVFPRTFIDELFKDRPKKCNERGRYVLDLRNCRRKLSNILQNNLLSIFKEKYLIISSLNPEESYLIVIQSFNAWLQPDESIKVFIIKLKNKKSNIRIGERSTLRKILIHLIVNIYFQTKKITKNDDFHSLVSNRLDFRCVDVPSPEDVAIQNEFYALHNLEVIETHFKKNKNIDDQFRIDVSIEEIKNKLDQIIVELQKEYPAQ